MNYFLKTERLGFTEWQEDFYGFALELWADPHVSRLIKVDGVFSEDEIKIRLQTEMQNKKIYDVQYYPIFLLNTNSFVGCCGLRPYLPEKSIYEFGFYLKPDYWGKGYAFEAAKAIIDYSVCNIPIQNIYAGHHPENAASKKSLERLGFRYYKEEYYEPTKLYHPLYALYPVNFND